jgi:hypothetical protein
MTLPALAFGFAASTLLGAVFHVWKGGSLGRLLLYITLAWAGFWAGHILGDSMGWTFGSIGPLRFGMALLASAVILYGGYWLSLISQDEQSHKER